MITNEYTLNLDIKKSMANVLPVFAKNETGVLRFRVFDEGTLYNLSDYINSQIAFILPNGMSYLGEANLENGFIVYNFLGIENSVIGTIKAVLTINSSSGSISTQPFKIEVFDNLRDEEINSITILQNLIAEVSLLNLQANQNLEGINSHVSNLTIHTNENEKNKWNSKAESFIFLETLNANSWIGSEAPFTQSVEIQEILEQDNPIIGPILSDVIQTAIQEQNSYDFISKASTMDGFLNFICFENKPEVDINIQIMVVR